MTLIQKINNLLKKKTSFISQLNAKNLGIQKFSPIFIISFLVIFSILFFITSNLINKNSERQAKNFNEIAKTDEFSNLKNFIISKINSPYKELII
jgi:hypothetical protein